MVTEAWILIALWVAILGFLFSTFESPFKKHDG